MFGDRLKEIRKRKGISQKELAQKLNVTQQTISHFENNENFPKFKTAQKMAAALNVSMHELTAGEIGYDWPIVEDDQPRPGNHFQRTPVEKITDIMLQLNQTGQEKVVDYASDLSGNPHYQAAAAPDPDDREHPDTKKPRT